MVNFKGWLVQALSSLVLKNDRDVEAVEDDELMVMIPAGALAFLKPVVESRLIVTMDIFEHFNYVSS